VTRVVGLAIVAAGLSITFLPVSTYVKRFYEYGPPSHHAECGSAWQAMFTDANGNNFEDFVCGYAAFPHLWIAGGVAALGVGIAFWGLSRGRLLLVVGLTLFGTALVLLAALLNSNAYGGV
jgi:hypothetical protein